MTWSRVGASLRSARERAGWSRETLAYHSGLSWAAIAQIESGRRREVRLGSLLALANALEVSVDYLVGGAATVSPKLLGHRLLVYRSDEEYLAVAAPFLQDGVAIGDCVVAVTGSRQGELLREALGEDCSSVEFWDCATWYGSPAQTLQSYRAYVKEQFAQGAHWVRILGEPVREGHSTAEAMQWTRYESMINVTLASSPATVLCPYDERSLPHAVLAMARQTHPEVAGTSPVPSPSYQEPEEFLLAGP